MFRGHPEDKAHPDNDRQSKLNEILVKDRLRFHEVNSLVSKNSTTNINYIPSLMTSAAQTTLGRFQTACGGVLYFDKQLLADTIVPQSREGNIMDATFSNIPTKLIQ